MEKISCALIGCGRISKNHVAALKNNSSLAKLVAVCDIVPEYMEQSLLVYEDISEVKRYTDYKLMLKEVKPQLVAIATESGLHANIALDAIKSGCNVLIEKPIALSLEDADAILKAAEDAGVIVGACHQNRFNKSIQKIRSAVEAGDFGQMLHGTAHIRWNRNEGYYTQAPWRGTWELDGGALMNQCIHNIDLLRWMMGNEVEEVFAYTDNLHHDYIQAEDLGIAVVKFKNKSYAIIEGTTNIYPKNYEETLYLFGSKGTAKAGGESVNQIDHWVFENQSETSEEVISQYQEKTENVYGFGHTPLYTDVLTAINEGRQPYVDGKAGRNALELVLAIYKSAATGKPVKLPLYNVKTTDFIGQFK